MTQPQSDTVKTHRRGLARRAENYPELCKLANTCAGIPDMTYVRLESTLKRAAGVLGVTPGAHGLLMLLCDYLTADSWRNGELLVWPSNHTLAAYTGSGLRTVQHRLAELERAGLLIRCYTLKNRRMARRARAEEGGIDLSPLGARFLEIESRVDVIRSHLEAAREAAYARRQDHTWEDARTCIQEQSPRIHTDSSVTGKSAAPRSLSEYGPLPEGSINNNSSGTPTQLSSPKGEAAGVQP